MTKLEENTFVHNNIKVRELDLTFNIALRYTVNDFNNLLAAFDEIAYKDIEY